MTSNLIYIRQAKTLIILIASTFLVVGIPVQVRQAMRIVFAVTYH